MSGDGMENDWLYDGRGEKAFKAGTLSESERKRYLEYFKMDNDKEKGSSKQRPIVILFGVLVMSAAGSFLCFYGEYTAAAIFIVGAQIFDAIKTIGDKR